MNVHSVLSHVSSIGHDRGQRQGEAGGRVERWAMAWGQAVQGAGAMAARERVRAAAPGHCRSGEGGT